MTSRIRTWLATILVLTAANLPGSRTALAQQMFLDTDGDGVYTSADQWPPDSPATIDLCLDTSLNSDGSPVGTDVRVYSYIVNLFAPSDRVSFTNIVNLMPGMVESVPLATYPYALSVGYAGFQTFPPGNYRLLRMEVEFQGNGCRALSIVPSSCYSPPNAVTSFGAYSLETGEDRQLLLGFDFSGSGFGCTDMTGHPPTIACPAEVRGQEGTPLAFTATVTDPECGAYPFSFFSDGFPAGSVAGPLTGFRAGEATQSVTWTPSPGQAGEYWVTFGAQKPDPFNHRDNRTTCLTHIAVISMGGNLAAAISPNPLGPNPVLKFATRTEGFATAKLFDARGRLVATILEERSVPIGFHRKPLTRLEQLRARLSSGIYFVRVSTEHDGTETRRVAVLR